MVDLNDFITLTPNDQTQLKAINYAARSYYYTYNRMGYDKSDLRKRILHIAVGIIIEQAFEKYLQTRSVIYDMSGRTHWRISDVGEFTARNKRIDVKGAHVYPYQDRQFPGWFLDVEGLVPADQVEKSSAPDVYVQAFLVAQPVNISSAGKYIALMPQAWAGIGRPRRISFALAGDCSSLEFAGETVSRNASGGLSPPQDTSELVQSGDYQSSQQWVSVQYVTSSIVPKCDIIISTTGGEKYVIRPGNWIDLWLDRPKVYLAGWGSVNDYREARLIPPGTPHRIYQRTRTANYGIPIRNLQSLSELERVLKNG